MAADLWLVRHGNREDLVDLDWGLTAARPHDPALSPDGMRQARAAGLALMGRGIRRVFTSPYLRCAQTAHLIARELARDAHTPVHLEPGLAELAHRDWTEGTPSMLPAVELAALTGPLDAGHTPVCQPIYPETIEEAFLRASRTARELAARYPETLLCVGHAVSVMGILRTLAVPAGDIPCDLASIHHLERVGDRWSATLVGDVSHLRDS
jgi:broad specificity phosphatase PhoE